jgi:hypothetical protein
MNARYNLIVLILFSVLLFTFNLFAQQSADTSFVPSNKNKTFTEGKLPVVLIDEAHNNYHTIDGRYQAFKKVLQSDGYIIKPNKCKFNIDTLKNADILVIANALNEKNTQNWELPNFSAFTRDEIENVYNWVKDGGSLLLIADHMPFPKAAQDLAAIFGFHFNNGFAIDTTSGRTIFRKSDNSLLNHPITNGLNVKEKIDSVRTFTGQAFIIPFNAQPIFVFKKPTISYMPNIAWEFNDKTPILPVDNWCQGATLEFFNGRIAIFGEAAMFTAQYNKRNKRWFGLRAKRAEQNEQFLLNVLHWLTKII